MNVDAGIVGPDDKVVILRRFRDRDGKLSIRRRDARALAHLLRRSRVRALLRWSRQLLVYRGWLPYLAAKLRRRR